MGTTSGQFTAALTEDHDVIVIEGLAVISNGFNRPTRGVDNWLDSLDSPQAWADVRNRTNEYLHEMSGEGDPFSQALLANTRIPPA